MDRALPRVMRVTCCPGYFAIGPSRVGVCLSSPTRTFSDILVVADNNMIVAVRRLAARAWSNIRSRNHCRAIILNIHVVKCCPQNAASKPLTCLHPTRAARGYLLIYLDTSLRSRCARNGAGTCHVVRIGRRRPSQVNPLLPSRSRTCSKSSTRIRCS